MGRSLYDAFKILWLGLGASERDVKLAYRNLARLYHPDKGEESRHITGMMLAETTTHYQLLEDTEFGGERGEIIGGNQNVLIAN